jgi:hypothetical protein
MADDDKTPPAPANPSKVVKGAAAPTKAQQRLDTTVPGGKYMNAEGKWVNANGDELDADGTIVRMADGSAPDEK